MSFLIRLWWCAAFWMLGTAWTFAGGEYSNLAVEKQVDNPRPLPDEPAEFTVDIINKGDYPAPDVHVKDKLPKYLIIPEGRGVFTDKGYYDVETGDWEVGDMEVNETAVMVIPTIVSGDELPGCIVNTAEVDHPQDYSDSNNRASMAIHGADNVLCADLAVGFWGSAGGSPTDFNFPTCDSLDRYEGTIRLFNRGPDEARDIEVTIFQDPVIGPNLRIEDPQCVSTNDGNCLVKDIPVGNEVQLHFFSDPFQNKTDRQQTIEVTASSVTEDYDLFNNAPAMEITVYAFSSCKDSPIMEDIPYPYGDSGGGGGGCFIATAAHGSKWHPRVSLLRGFRDRQLLTNPAGRRFVDWYYRHSPPVAEYIAKHTWLQAIVRAGLLPLVVLIAHPFLGIVGLLSLLAAGWVLTHRLESVGV